MQGLKSAILAIFQNGLGWLWPVSAARIPCKNPTQNKNSFCLAKCGTSKKLFKMGPNMTLLTVQTVCYSLVCQKFKMPHISTLPSCTFFKVKIENNNVIVEMSCILRPFINNNEFIRCFHQVVSLNFSMNFSLFEQ